MGSELLQAKPPAPAQTARPQHRYRLRFQKTGDLRLVSHIDLLHVFERLLRRAALPFASTQGFHPKPCLIFAQALALGVAGLDEVVDLTLAEPLPPEEVLVRLNRQAPAGLVFLEAKALTRKGCRPMDFTGRPMRGFVFVDLEGFDSERDLTFWLELALAYNPVAKKNSKKSR